MIISVSKSSNSNISFYPFWLIEENICDEIPLELRDKLNKDKNLLSSIFSKKRYLFNDNEANLINLDMLEKINIETIRRYISIVYQIASKEFQETIDIYLFPKAWNLDDLQVLNAAIECLMLLEYKYDGFKKNEEREFKIKNVSLIVDNILDDKKIEEIFHKNKIISDSIYLVKDLINGPANIITIDYLENYAVSLAENNKLNIKVFNESDLIKEKMNLILAVGGGGHQKPRLLELSYTAGKDFPTVCLVGKGIVFDSGGLNLKPGGSLEEMKSDMAGAATVLGLIKAASELKLKVNIIAILPLAENSVDKNSYRPGDVFIAYNKMSVVIKNTDAEGRLILADALSYSDTKNPDITIDFATLTGSALFALGRMITASFFRDSEIKEKIIGASKTTGESLWEMPLFEDYRSFLKDDIADIPNIADPPREAGTIMGALFLSEFVKNKKWVHFDIAGTAFIDKQFYYNSKGATGVLIRTIINFLENY